MTTPSERTLITGLLTALLTLKRHSAAQQQAPQPQSQHDLVHSLADMALTLGATYLEQKYPQAAPEVQAVQVQIPAVITQPATTGTTGAEALATVAQE